MTDAPQVTDNTDAARFELALDGHLAELTYRRRANRLVLVHTGVPDALSGQGIGGRLVSTAVERASAEGLTLVPLCAFARTWLERHPDVAATITIDWGTQDSS